MTLNSITFGPMPIAAMAAGGQTILLLPGSRKGFLWLSTTSVSHGQETQSCSNLDDLSAGHDDTSTEWALKEVQSKQGLHVHRPYDLPALSTAYLDIS